MKQSTLRIFFITCLSLFYGAIAFAQEPPSIPERRALAARRDKFVCKELSLTNEECTKLTIILHQMDEERMNIWAAPYADQKKSASITGGDGSVSETKERMQDQRCQAC